MNSFLSNPESKTDYLHEFFPIYRGLKVERYFGDHWCMHLPFAYELMRELKPKVFVELGVWKGESYFTFCQSVAENHLDTQCFGVDTWSGDVHMGSFGSELSEEVVIYNQRYSAFSRLKKMRFLDAAKDFADGSIHLLHIDGGHRYEDVKEDFDSWLPKVADGGIILFHDVEVRDRSFGVWKFWKEIAQLRTSFLFTFGHGLGVWKKGPPSDRDPELLRRLFSADAEEQKAINRHYLSLGVALQSWWNVNCLQAVSESKDAEIGQMRAALELRDAEIGHLKTALESRDAEIARLDFEFRDVAAAIEAQKRTNNELNRALASAVQWQQRSWTKRSFHKWRVPRSGKKTKTGFFRKLERSIRKRRNLLLSKLLGRTNQKNKDLHIELGGKMPAAVSPQTNCPTLEGNAQTIRFGLILSVHNTRTERLERILAALSNQNYRNWHLWVLDEGSDNSKTLHILQAYQGSDDRITVLRGKIASNVVDLPEIPSEIDSDYLVLLPDAAVMPPGFLTTRFMELQGLKLPEPVVASNSFAARFFVRENAEADHSQIAPPRVRAIAFFLPQFHAIPENDVWWGEGFTEWTNVKRAFPLYPGHNQPRVPHPDVGYYNLLDAEVKERQAEMASRYGIHGFCYYFYWFGGKRVLEKPLEQILRSGSPDLPFCLCWANENWSRRWDGSEHELLLSQCHSDEDDEAMIRCVIEYFRDPRYIRVDGKPLFVIYRPSLLPDPKATFARWRQVCREEGIGEIYLCSTRTFAVEGPGDTGVDAMIQFPPHGVDGLTLQSITPAKLDANPSFTGSLFNFDDYRMGYLADTNKSFKLFRGVMPSWDNTPRRLKNSTIVHGSSLKKYYWWLHEAVQQTESSFEGDERLVFINAWNEWAEGAYLEPDTTHGYRTLEVTRRALYFPIPCGWHEVLHGGPPQPKEQAPPVLVIAHDAYRAGAQIVLLTLLREWKRTQPFPIRLLLVGDGALRSEFEALCFPSLVLSDYSDACERRSALQAFLSPRPRIVYSNTVVNGLLLDEIQWLGCPVVTHVHELQKAIERWAPEVVIAATLRCSSHYIAASQPVAENLFSKHGVEKGIVSTIHEFIDTGTRFSEEAIAKARNELKLQGTETVIFGCGTTDWRKGPDLFIEIAAKAIAVNPHLRFFWIGMSPSEERQSLDSLISAKGLRDHVQFLGEKSNPRDYFCAGHIFLLSSREDPFPLVALEAASVGMPVVCFDGSGGMPGFVGDDCGCTVPQENIAAAASAIVNLAGNSELRNRLGARAREKVVLEHSTAKAAREIASLFGVLSSPGSVFSDRWNPSAPLVTVIVPNYNHSRFLPERLQSIVAQGIENIEILLLDDASKDNSVEVLEEFARKEPRTHIVINQTNSGSTFKQWQKALALAKGKYIWIAESDDSAEPALLRTLLQKFERDPGLALAYTQCRMISDEGKDLGIPLGWTDDIARERWRNDYIASGLEEIRKALSIKNTILNASGVVFRNFKGIVDLVDPNLRYCGDWRFWIRLCARGRVAFNATPLNLWRQKTSNARTKPDGELEWEEGRSIIEEAARLLSCSDAERISLVKDFHEKCKAWNSKATGNCSETLVLNDVS